MLSDKYLFRWQKVQRIRQETLTAQRRKRPEWDTKSRVRVFVVLTAAVIDCLKEINCLCFQGYQKAGAQHLIVSNGWPWKETKCHCCQLTVCHYWLLTCLLEREEAARMGEWQRTCIAIVRPFSVWWWDRPADSVNGCKKKKWEEMWYEKNGGEEK